MNSIEVNKKNLEYWNEFYKDCKREDVVTDDWLWTFEKIINDSRGPVLDLGCGDGNNIINLLNRGKNVSAADGSINAILNIRKNFPEVKEAICFDMLDTFPYANNSTDLVVADLCLQYFTKEDTIKILKEIRRVLVNRGHMLFRVNSMDDVNYMPKNATEVEKHLYLTEDGRYKRFFDYADIYEFFNMFDIKYIREGVTNKYKLEKKLYVCDVRNIK